MGSATPRLKIPGLKVPGAARASRSARILSLIALICGFAIAFFAYELGQIRAGHNRLEAQQRYQDLQSELIRLQRETRRLREQLVQGETNAKIDNESYRQVETRLAELQATILKQQEDLAFYRGIVSADQDTGLRIQDFELLRGANDSSFSLRLVLAQALRNDKRISGHVELNVEGKRDGEPLSLDLADLAAEATEGARIDFSFRYFQNLQAELVLPKGFAPERVIVKLKPTGKSVKAVEESFDWPALAG